MKARFSLGTHADVVRNILWLILEKGAGVGLTLVCSAILARALPLELFGKWQYAQSVGALLASLSLVAGAEVTIPALARNLKLASSIVGSAFLVRLAGAFVALPIGYVVVSMLIQDRLAIALVLFFMMQLAMNEAFAVVANYFQASVNIRPVVFCRFSALALRSLAFVLIFLTSRSIVAFSFAMLIECMATGVFLLRLAGLHNLHWQPAWNVARILVTRGLGFWPGLVLMYIFTRGDRIYVEHFFSYEAVGQFAIAQQLVEQGFVLLMIAVQSIAPRYILARQDDAKLLARTTRVALLVLVCTIAASIVASIVGPLFLHIIYGDKYAEGAHLFQVMCFAMIPYGLDAVLNTALLRQKAARLLVFKWAAASICSFLMYYFFARNAGSGSLGYIYLSCYLILLAFSLICTLVLFNGKMRSRLPSRESAPATII